MKTKIVYVLVSGETDIYLEQALVSLYSLRLRNPDAPVVLLVDERTDETLKGKRSAILEFVSTKVVVDLSSRQYTPQQRSRELKTRVREFVEGDFLFVDCDTVIAGPLDGIDSLDAELAAVIDSHAAFDRNPYRKMILKQTAALGFAPGDDQKYFNSGVIRVRDTPATHEFYKRWNALWKAGLDAGISMDQPSFAKANQELNLPIREIPGEWNCQVRHGMFFWNRAKIIHYLCTNISSSETPIYYLMRKEVYLGIKESGRLPDDLKTRLAAPFALLETSVSTEPVENVMFQWTAPYKISKDLYLRHPRLFRLETKVLNFIKKMDLK